MPIAAIVPATPDLRPCQRAQAVIDRPRPRTKPGRSDDMSGFRWSGFISQGIDSTKSCVSPSPEVGSSRKMIDGCCTVSTPMDTRRLSPSEKKKYKKQKQSKIKEKSDQIKCVCVWLWLSRVTRFIHLFIFYFALLSLSLVQTVFYRKIKKN